MKKIFTLCIAACSAMMVFAQTPMTVAEAVAATQLLQPNSGGTDTVAVTGYVTYSDEVIKATGKQAIVWIDDVQGTNKAFEAYNCTLPQELIDANDPLHKGDKITVIGVLYHYQSSSSGNSTYEIKDGEIVVLEHQNIEIEVIDMSICEALAVGQSLIQSGEEETDFKAKVQGTVTKVSYTNAANQQQSFYIKCEEADDENNGNELYAYNAIIEGDLVEVGDVVEVVGKVKPYNTTIEICGNAKVIEKGNVEVEVIPVTVAEAVAIGNQHEGGKTTEAVYAVTGYCDSIAYAFGGSDMSFYMCDDLANPTYEFEAYRAQTEVDIPVGTKVTVTGNIYHYVKNAGTETESHLIEISNGKAVIYTGINNTVIVVPVEKFIMGGNLYIRKDGVTYTVQGNVVK